MLDRAGIHPAQRQVEVDPAEHLDTRNLFSNDVS
jgi:hypothetical protein